MDPSTGLNTPMFENYERTHFADYCKILRGPFSTRELAAIVGVTHSAVEQWEAGTSFPRPPVLRKLITHYQDWSITKGLGDAAARANKELSHKIRLTRRNRRATTPQTYIPTGE